MPFSPLDGIPFAVKANIAIRMNRATFLADLPEAARPPSRQA